MTLLHTLFLNIINIYIKTKHMEIEVGDIILLTRRKLDWNIPRWILSQFIYFFNGKFVHSALPFYKDDKLYVREMEIKGSKIDQSLESYIEQYGDRMYIMKKIIPITSHQQTMLSYFCSTEKAKYEYIQLIYQVIKSIFHIFIGKKTPIKRTCSEDTARIYNRVENIFEHPESITPFEISKYDEFVISKLK